jgi:hypothetical protein
VSSKKWHSLQLISGGLLVITSYLNTLDGYYTRFLVNWCDGQAWIFKPLIL